MLPRMESNPRSRRTEEPEDSAATLVPGGVVVQAHRGTVDECKLVIPHDPTKIATEITAP